MAHQPSSPQAEAPATEAITPNITLRLPLPERRMVSFGDKALFPLSESAQQDFDQFVLPTLVRLFAEAPHIDVGPIRYTTITVHPCRVRYQRRFCRGVTEVNGIVIGVSGHSRVAKDFARAAKKLIDRSGVCQTAAIPSVFKVFVQDQPAQWSS